MCLFYLPYKSGNKIYKTNFILHFSFKCKFSKKRDPSYCNFYSSTYLELNFDKVDFFLFTIALSISQILSRFKNQILFVLDVSKANQVSNDKLGLFIGISRISLPPFVTMLNCIQSS
jgi:hypothetical protein